MVARSELSTVFQGRKGIMLPTNGPDATRYYLLDIKEVRKRQSLLGREDEVRLAKRMERGKKAVEELGSGRELSPLRESRLLVVKKAGEEARKTFIEANLGLVVTTAKKYARRMELEDRIQEGNCGLIMAVDKFDWRRGCKFSTYATWWIRQAVTRAISDRARVIRIPTHALEDISRYVKTYDSLRATLGREPGAEEIANAMGITTKRVRELAFWQSVEPGSLDMSVGEDGDGALADFVEDSASSPEEEFGRLADREWVRLLLQDIPPRIKRILEMRYGQGMTLEHIAREEGITRERVRQIIARAEGRLREKAYEKDPEAKYPV